MIKTLTDELNEALDFIREMFESEKGDTFHEHRKERTIKAIEKAVVIIKKTGECA